MSVMDADSIVIGSGAGGLSAALALATQGQKVIVLEQHYTPGGWCHSFTKQGYRFNPGVHYVGELSEGEFSRKIFESLGLGGELAFFEMNPDGFEHCYLGQQKVFNYVAGCERLEEAFIHDFPREASGLNSYFGILRNAMNEFHNVVNCGNLVDYLKLPLVAPTLSRLGLFSLSSIIKSRIADPKLQLLLSIQCGDQGLTPKNTSFLLHTGISKHLIGGGYYPKGGAQAIPWAMIRKLKKLGGDVKVGKEVRSIIVETIRGKRRAIGVTLADGRQLRANNIVSNADPGQTFGKLIDKKHLSSRLLRKVKNTKYSLSSVILFLAVDLDLRQYGFDSGNTWYADTPDIEKHANELKDPSIYERRSNFPVIFISIPSLKDPSSWNGKAHTMEVLTLVSYDKFAEFEDSMSDTRSDAYLRLKDKITDMFLNNLDIICPEIRKNIVFQDLGTPITNNYYARATNGCVYGTENSIRQLGPFGYKNTTEIENLTLTGASTGYHGVVGATFTGIKAAASILGGDWRTMIESPPNTAKLQILSSEHFEKKAASI